MLVVPPRIKTDFKYYVYHTDKAQAESNAFTVYATNDLRKFTHLGKALHTNARSFHWAPCVVFNGSEFVMLYSRSTPDEPNPEIGDKIRRAVGEKPVQMVLVKHF